MIPEASPNTINDGALLALLKKGPKMDAPTVTGTVQLGKPWYLSKKFLLALLGLALVVYQGVTGKTAENLPEVLDHIGKVAGVLGVIVPAILAIAHVDAKERALILDAIGAAADLAKADPAPASLVTVAVDPVSGRPS